MLKSELGKKIEAIQNKIMELPLEFEDVTPEEDDKLQDVIHNLEVAIRKANRIANNGCGLKK